MKPENMDQKPRRRYDETYKRNAVELTMRGDRTLAAVARELGVSQGMLHDWRHKFAPRPGVAVGEPKTIEQANDEIARLRSELVRMQEREIVLKKSLGILSETPERSMPGSKR